MARPRRAHTLHHGGLRRGGGDRCGSQLNVIIKDTYFTFKPIINRKALVKKSHILQQQILCRLVICTTSPKTGSTQSGSRSWRRAFWDNYFYRMRNICGQWKIAAKSSLPPGQNCYDPVVISVIYRSVLHSPARGICYDYFSIRYRRVI